MVEAEGTRVAIEKRPGSISSVTILFDAGSRYDPEGKEGLANFTGEMLLRGTKELPRREFLKRVENLGEINIHTEADFIAVTLTAEHKNMEKLMKLFFSAVVSPALSEEEIESARAKLKGELNSIFNSPQAFVRYLLPFYLFPQHPYGHPPSGTPEGVENIKRPDIENFFSFISRQGINIGIVSPYPEGEIRVIENFLKSRNEAEKVAEIEVPAKRDGIKRIKRKGISQSYIEVVCYLPPARQLKEEALAVFNAAFGGSFTSRLVQRIRVEAGLAYSVHSYIEWWADFTLLRISTATEREEELLEAIQRECERISEGIEDKELLRAKQYLAGNLPLKFERAENTSCYLARRIFYGMGEKTLEEFIENLKSVKKKDLESVIEKISREKFVFVIGP